MKLKSSLITITISLICLLLCTSCLGLREKKLAPKEKTLIFKEVFWVGTHYPEAGTPIIPKYDYDSYFIIYNNTDKVIYLDSICVAMTAFVLNTNASLNADNNFTATHVGVSNILRFPGRGRDYPIKPREDKVICKIAMDHSLSVEEKWEKYTFSRDKYDVVVGPGAEGWCSKAANLENADFEWLNPIQMARSPFYVVDENDVPNMVPVFQGYMYNVDDSFFQDFGWGPGIYRAINTKDRWEYIDLNDFKFEIPENRSLVLFKPRIPLDSLDQEEYWWDYENTNQWHSIQLPTQEDVEEYGWSVFHHRHVNESAHAVRIPNEWIIDCVTICAQKNFLRKRLDDTVDAGYNSVKEDTDERDVMKFSGYALHRKHDGEEFLDNNNSTVDYEKQPASLLTEKPPVLLFPNITITTKSLKLTVGQEPVRIKFKVTPKRSKNRKPTWESSDEEVVTVDEKGYVTPVKAGTAVVTATLPNGANDKCDVTVVEGSDKE